MEVRIKLIMPDTLETLARSKPGAIASAIEKAVTKTLSREVRVSARIAYAGEDYDGEPIEGTETTQE